MIAGGKPITEDFRKRVVVVREPEEDHVHSTLVIGQPTEEDAGEYVAMATSVEGEQVTYTNVLCINQDTYHSEVCH